MKRHGKLFERMCSMENLVLADHEASKGKSNQRGVQKHRANQEANIHSLHELLVSGNFRTSAYNTFEIKEPKVRIISVLPYFPDRIVQCAAMIILESILVPTLNKDTYSCIKGRGIHSAADNIKLALKDVENTKYCLKIDIKKFYPSIDHDILKSLLRRKIKDSAMLNLLDEIIDSAPGLPIGNRLSQCFGNLYLSGLDHWIKEIMRVKYFFRYCDDMVIFDSSKLILHQLLADIRWYVETHLKLEIKGNYQIFPVESRGVDFLGYVFRHDYTLLRKTIKQNFARAISKGKSKASLAAYQGWAKHANTLNLMKKFNDKTAAKLQGLRYTGRNKGDGGGQNRYVPSAQQGN